MKYYVVREKGLEWSVVGLGNSPEEALAEPLDNGYFEGDLTVIEITREQYEHYLNLYT